MNYTHKFDVNRIYNNRSKKDIDFYINTKQSINYNCSYLHPNNFLIFP